MYSKRHVCTVIARLMQYDLSILTGLNIFGECDICYTVPPSADCCAERCMLKNKCMSKIRAAEKVTEYSLYPQSVGLVRTRSSLIRRRKEIERTVIKSNKRAGK